MDVLMMIRRCVGDRTASVLGGQTLQLEEPTLLLQHQHQGESMGTPARNGR